MWERDSVPNEKKMYWESGVFCLLFLASALESFKDTFIGQE